MDDPDFESRKTKYITPNFHLKLSLKIIYYMGTWPPQEYYYCLYLIGTACSFIFILGINLLAEIANLIVVWGDVPMIVAGSTVLMTNAVHAYKVVDAASIIPVIVVIFCKTLPTKHSPQFFVILFRQKRIRSLLVIAKGELFTRDNERHKPVVTHYTWQGLFHHIAYQSLGAVAVFCWAITPLADSMAGRPRRLALEGWYPFNVTASPAFEIVSTHQSVALIVACFHNVAMDTLVTGLITVTCCQFALLKRNIASIRTKTPRATATKIRMKELQGNKLLNESDPYEELVKCVEHCDAIFQFASEIENIFGTMIFFQFFVNCFIICMIAFHISQMTIYIPAVLLGMTMYMCCMTYQIFIYCWHGNELHLHSADIARAAYLNDWWNGDERFKRSLQIVITRAHKPVALVAGNIMSLSLQTFVGILRMSYSIFTVLQTSTGASDS